MNGENDINRHGVSYVLVAIFLLTLAVALVACGLNHDLKSGVSREDSASRCIKFTERVEYLISHTTEFSDNELVSSAVFLLARAYNSGNNNKIGDDCGEIRYQAGNIAIECSTGIGRNPYTTRDCRGILLYEDGKQVSEIDMNYSKGGDDVTPPIPELSYTFFVNDGIFGYMIIYFPEGPVKYAVTKFRYSPGYVESVPVLRYNVMRNK